MSSGANRNQLARSGPSLEFGKALHKARSQDGVIVLLHHKDLCANDDIDGETRDNRRVD